MLVIRQAQMKVLEAAQRKRAELRMALRLRAAFPEKTEPKTDDDLAAIVRLGVERAAMYRIIRESAVCRYLQLMVMLSPYFDIDPATAAWARPILTSKLDDEDKLDSLMEHVQFGSVADS